MSGVVFIDTETTGLDPTKHEIWDLALITEDGREYQWFFPPQQIGYADPIALDIGHYYERTSQTSEKWTNLDGKYSGEWSNPMNALQTVRELTWNKHLVGAVPSFDEERLRYLMQRHGIPFKWHYHLIDIEALAVGYLQGKDKAAMATFSLPWKSRALYEALGVTWDSEDEHTALGDARLAKAVYEKVMGK